MSLLLILSSYIPVFTPRVVRRFLSPPLSSFPFLLKHAARIDRASEESIMKLFKFVSNIEISFMPGKLIIKVYRRTRSWPGSRGMIFLFFARPLFSIARTISISRSILSFVTLSPSSSCRHACMLVSQRTSKQAIFSCLVNSIRSISPTCNRMDITRKVAEDRHLRSS